VAEIVLEKQSQRSKIKIVHWQKRSSVWIIVPATERKEEVRMQEATIYKGTTHILENTWGRDNSIH